MLQLATSQKTSLAHRNVVPQLRVLADQLVLIIQAGQTEQAREMVRRFILPPIAWGFLASRLQKNQVPAEIIEMVLS